MSDTNPTVICQECGFENSGPTLYCQDCGARLVHMESGTSFTPSGPAPVSAPLNVPPPVAQTHAAAASPKSKSKSAPRRKMEFPVASILGAIIRPLFYAALVALLIQVMRKPAGLPPRIQALPEETVQRVRTQMQQKAATGGDIHAPWNSLNSYLAAVLAPRDKPGKQSVSFSRAALAPAADGEFALYADRKILGLHLYTVVFYKPVSRGGGLGLVATGSAIGRVHLPAAMAGLVETTLGGLDTALYLELEILRNAQGVDISQSEAILHFPAPTP